MHEDSILIQNVGGRLPGRTRIEFLMKWSQHDFYVSTSEKSKCMVRPKNVHFLKYVDSRAVTARSVHCVINQNLMLDRIVCNIRTLPQAWLNLFTDYIRPSVRSLYSAIHCTEDQVLGSSNFAVLCGWVKYYTLQSHVPHLQKEL